MEDPTRIARLDLRIRLAVALVAVLCAASPLAGGPSIDIEGCEFLIAVGAGMAVVGAVYGPARRNVPAFALSGTMVADLMAYALIFGVASYVVAFWRLPLIDAELAAAERALGFDWRGHQAFIDSAPVVKLALQVGYYSMMPQLGLLAVILCLRKDLAGLRLLLNGFAVCALLAILLSGLFPALGAFPHYGLLAPGQQDLGTIPAIVAHPYQQMLAIRSGEMTAISVLTVSGIITFPSFHTMSAVVFCAAALRVPALRWPGLVLNGLMIAATPGIGGHFLVDTLFGLVAALGIVLALRLAVAPRASVPAAAGRAEAGIAAR